MTAAGGKLDPKEMELAVYRHLGTKSRRVLVGPKRGFDNAVVSVGGKKVMILTTDPVSVIPALGIRDSAWLSVHLIASDYATSGHGPKFASFDFNFPPDMATADRDSYLESIGSTCRELGVSIVAGHTGSYPGAGFTVVGGGVMFGFVNRGGYVDPSMALEGDAVLMTKGAAIEAAASLACSFPEYTEKKVGTALAAKVRALVKSCSTVKDALCAATLGLGRGGVSSMHDATEGGVLGGLDEMAAASGKFFSIDAEKVLHLEGAAAVCSAFRIDELTSLSEGTLLVTCAFPRVEELVKKLRRVKVESAVIGRVGKGRGLRVSYGGRPPRPVRPRSDPYWEAYSKALREGLK